MRSSAIFSFAVTMLIGACIIVLFTSYGNTKVHPGINEMIVESFISKTKDPQTKLPEFKNYYFNLDLVQQCKGIAMTKSGFFQPDDVNWINREMENATGIGSVLVDLATLKATTEEGPAEKSVKEWISHGGYSADEPELPASLRHFYDPNEQEGIRYLTDITNAKLMGAMQRMLKNPEIDGVDWALGKPGDLSSGVQEHAYTWEKGKAWVKMALQEKNEDKRSEDMGKAWRSLGETLHMIADNGCPPHVRNDAHPSPLCNYNIIFGNPDPYEEIIDIIRKDNPDDFIQYFKGTPDKVLTDQIKGMKTAREIAHALAVFTNTNFVTGETISGTDKGGTQWKQIINEDDPYHSPLLQHMDYDKNTGMFSIIINKNTVPVKQCNDKVYWVDLIPEICYSYVTFECVESQAKLLLPTVVEAGRKVMELFIPKLKVEIKSAENGQIKGQITHKTDQEYTSEIKYSGKVTLFIKDKNHRKKREAEVNVINGQFSAPGINFENGDFVCVRIDFGGIGVESPEFKCGGIIVPQVPVENKHRREMSVSVYCYGCWSNTVNWNNVKWGGCEWTGATIDDKLIQPGAIINYSGYGLNLPEVTVNMEVNENQFVNMMIHTGGKSDGPVEYWDIVAENIPFYEEFNTQKQYRAYSSKSRLGFPGVHIESLVKKVSCVRIFPDGQKQTLTNIDWEAFENYGFTDLASHISVRISDR
ncbi:MAG: hypothetical protein WCR72_03535 [Bacteroidota bacterium]